VRRQRLNHDHATTVADWTFAQQGPGESFVLVPVIRGGRGFRGRRHAEQLAASSQFLVPVPIKLMKNPQGTLSQGKVAMLHNAVMAACDLPDGVRDGLIGDPQTCHFDVNSLFAHIRKWPCTTEQARLRTRVASSVKRRNSTAERYPILGSGRSRKKTPY